MRISHAVLRAAWDRWSFVSLFAIAFAWVEAAVVFYLRTLVGRIDPHQSNPLPVGSNPDLGPVEIAREAATMIMLFTVGWLGGRTWRSRLGYVLVAFGVWDIFYYAFLRAMTGWPRSVMDWDVLFLIPLPWWGPVLAPTLIAALMIVGGTLVAQFDSPEHPLWPARGSIAVSAIGMVLALYVFMADALRVVHQGEQALRDLLPTEFNWPLFLLALPMMAAPLWALCQRLRSHPGFATHMRAQPSAHSQQILK
jgi:hypothetical protein